MCLSLSSFAFLLSPLSFLFIFVIFLLYAFSLLPPSLYYFQFLHSNGGTLIDIFVVIDGEKRKREDDDEVESKSVKPKEEKDAVVTEEEVEEFFTILRRIHEAARQYGQPDREGGRKLTTSKKVHRSHDWTDFPSDLPRHNNPAPRRNNPSQPWPVGRPLRFEPSAFASFPETQHLRETTAATPHPKPT